MFGFVLAIAIAVYLAPTVLELQLLNHHASPWLACVLVGDVIGSVVLFALGFRREAVAVYLLATLIEGTLLFAGVSPQMVAWFSNAMPAAVLLTLMSRAALHSLVLNDEF